MNESKIIWNRAYTFDVSAPTRVVDADMGLDMDVSLFCQVNVSLKPASGTAAELPGLTEAELREMISFAVMMAYGSSVYPNGMPLGELQLGKPSPAVLTETRSRLDDNLSLYGVAAASFDIAKHWVGTNEKALLDDLLKRRELLDPQKAAEALMKQTMDTIARKGWICPCGRTNNTRFCPECGRPATSGKAI